MSNFPTKRDDDIAAVKRFCVMALVLVALIAGGLL